MLASGCYLCTPFDLPFFSSEPRKVMICGKHGVASVQDIKIDEALLVLCPAYYVKFDIAELRCYGFHVLRRFTSIRILRIFCNGWMDCRDAFHAVLCLYCCATIDNTHTWIGNAYQNHLRILVMMRQVQGIFVSVHWKAVWSFLLFIFRCRHSSYIVYCVKACIEQERGMLQTQNIIAIGDQWIPAGAHQQ